jgi:hypothetical protein
MSSLFENRKTAGAPAALCEFRFTIEQKAFSSGPEFLRFSRKYFGKTLKHKIHIQIGGGGPIMIAVPQAQHNRGRPATGAASGPCCRQNRLTDHRVYQLLIPGAIVTRSGPGSKRFPCPKQALLVYCSQFYGSGRIPHTMPFHIDRISAKCTDHDLV